MTILADDIAAISSYNDGIVVETSPMTTALEQYWAERKRICDETVGQLQQSPTDVDAERAWDYFCSYHTPFLRGYLKRSVNDLGAPLRRLWGWHFGLIREARRAFLSRAVDTGFAQPFDCGSCSRQDRQVRCDRLAGR